MVVADAVRNVSSPTLSTIPIRIQSSAQDISTVFVYPTVHKSNLAIQ